MKSPLKGETFILYLTALNCTELDFIIVTEPLPCMILQKSMNSLNMAKGKNYT